MHSYFIFPYFHSTLSKNSLLKTALNVFCKLILIDWACVKHDDKPMLWNALKQIIFQSMGSVKFIISFFEGKQTLFIIHLKIARHREFAVREQQ